MTQKIETQTIQRKIKRDIILTILTDLAGSQRCWSMVVSCRRGFESVGLAVGWLCGISLRLGPIRVQPNRFGIDTSGTYISHLNSSSSVEFWIFK